MPPLSELQLNTETFKRCIQSIESTEIDPDIEERAERGRLSDPHLDAIVGLPSDTYSAKSTEISAALSKLQSEGGLESHMRGRSSANCPYLGRLGITLAVSPEAHTDQSRGETPAEVRARLRAKASAELKDSDDTIAKLDISNTVTVEPAVPIQLNNVHRAALEQVVVPESLPTLQATEHIVLDDIQLSESLESSPVVASAAIEPLIHSEAISRTMTNEVTATLLEVSDTPEFEVIPNSNVLKRPIRKTESSDNSMQLPELIRSDEALEPKKSSTEIIEQHNHQPSIIDIESRGTPQNIVIDGSPKTIAIDVPELPRDIKDTLALPDHDTIMKEVVELFSDTTLTARLSEIIPVKLATESFEAGDSGIDTVDYDQLSMVSPELPTSIAGVTQIIETRLRDISVNQPELLTLFSSESVVKIVDRLMPMMVGCKNESDKVVVRSALIDALTTLCDELSIIDDRELSKAIGTHEYKFYDASSHSNVIGATKQTVRQWAELSRYVITQARLSLGS